MNYKKVSAFVNMAYVVVPCIIKMKDITPEKGSKM